MDNLTTQLSRVIVNHLKRNKDANPIPSFKGQVNDLLLRAEFERRPGVLRHVGGEYNYAYRELLVRIAVPEKFNERELSIFIPTLKNVLRHELEHYRQDQRSRYEEPRAGTHYADPTQASNTGHQPGINPFSSVEAARTYFLSPHETEAFVMGLYKQAKTSKESLRDLISKKTTEIGGSLYQTSGIPRQEAFKVAREISQAWNAYAEKRIPSAKRTFGELV